MTAVQSSLVTIAREWPWGIVCVVDTEAGSELPDDIRSDRPVTVATSGLVVAIRHAQDAVDGSTQAIVVVRRRDGATVPDLVDVQVLADAVIQTPGGALDIGDADEWYRVPTHPGRTRIVVTVADDEDLMSADAVVLDLLSAEPPN